MAKIYQILIGIFLLFIGVVTLILVFLIGSVDPSTSSSSSSSDFPFVIFIPIFFGAFIPIIAAVKKRR
ncbi:MAG: hypothetical protein ACXADY_24095 [Candidatus Hodarchaeales archaeon]